MVEGTLREMEREPENVQVVVEERRQVVTELTVTMMDETGVLKTIKKTETETTPTSAIVIVQRSLRICADSVTIWKTPLSC